MSPEEYQDRIAELYRETELAAGEYGSLALWRRLPPELQGDISPSAWKIRDQLAEIAAQRWIELTKQYRALEHEAYEARRAVSQ